MELPGGEQRRLPDVGFVLQHLADYPPVRARVVVERLLARGKRLQINGYYSGDKFWHLNPGFGVSGHFSLPGQINKRQRIKVSVQVSVIDPYGREHALLPITYAYRRDTNTWYLEP